MPSLHDILMFVRLALFAYCVIQFLRCLMFAGKAQTEGGKDRAVILAVGALLAAAILIRI